jgi:hypothetical protein
LVSWTYSYFTYRLGARIITGWPIPTALHSPAPSPGEGLASPPRPNIKSEDRSSLASHSSSARNETVERKSETTKDR